MLNRTRSYPEGLCQKSRQHTFRSERNLPQLARQSDPYGPHVSHKVHRVDASRSHEHPLSKGKPAYDSLTKPSTASTYRSMRDILRQKDSTNQQAQVALVPASLIYKERACKDLYRSSNSQSNKLQRETTLQGALNVAVSERNDESKSNICEVQTDRCFSASDLVSNDL